MPHRCTDELKSVDIRHLAGEQGLEPGRITWRSWGRGGKTSATLKTEARPGGLWVEYQTRLADDGWHTFSRLVTLERTTCHLGGERVWWQCPRCRKRVALLYGGRELACRHCWDAAYRCQRETDEDRSLRKTDKLRRRLGWPAGVMNGMGPRPKGMHGTTYAKLLREHSQRSAETLGHLGRSLQSLTGRRTYRMSK